MKIQTQHYKLEVEDVGYCLPGSPVVADGDIEVIGFVVEVDTSSSVAEIVLFDPITMDTNNVNKFINIAETENNWESIFTSVLAREGPELQYYWATMPIKS